MPERNAEPSRFDDRQNVQGEVPDLPVDRCFGVNLF